MTASHGDISVQGSLTAQKDHACSVDLLPDGHIVTVGVATSPNVADLSTSFNGMNLNTWACPSSSFGTVFRWISGALNEHYLKFWSTKFNAEKPRDAQGTKSKFYEH